MKSGTKVCVLNINGLISYQLLTAWNRSIFFPSGSQLTFQLAHSVWQLLLSFSTMVAWNGHSKCIDIVILSVPRVLLHLFHFNSRNLFLYLQSKTLNVKIARSLLRFKTYSRLRDKHRPYVYYFWIIFQALLPISKGPMFIKFGIKNWKNNFLQFFHYKRSKTYSRLRNKDGPYVC